MARRKNRGMILRVAFSLIMIYILPGAISPCSEPLMNIALLEGTLNTLIYYPVTPDGVQWSVLPTTNELTRVDIVNYTDDQVDPVYAADYSFSPQGLTIKAATTTADYNNQHQLSTAGLYTVQCSGGKQISFKVLVVTSGPTCSISSDKTSVSCSSTYADSTYDPIAAVFTLYVNGNPVTTDTPQKTSYDANTWISTSTFPITYNAVSTYQCVQTFGQPTEVQDSSLVMNAPRFNQSCSYMYAPTETVATTKPSTTTTSTVATIKSSATASIPTLATTKSSTAARSSTKSTTITTKTATTLKLVSYGTGTVLTIPPTAQSSATANAANDTTTPLITSELSEGGKIGFGVGIGVGGILALGGILLAVLCRRSQRVKKIKTDDGKTKGMEDDCERGRSHEDNSIVQNYEPLKVPSSQEANYEQLTPSTIVNAKDQVSPSYESCDHTMGACEPRKQPPSDKYDSIIEQT